MPQSSKPVENASMQVQPSARTGGFDPGVRKADFCGCDLEACGS